VNVREGVFGLARRTGLGDGLAFLHLRPATHEERSEMGERGLVAVGGTDRHGQSVRRHLACERDLSRSRSTDDAGAVEGDVDTAVLATRVGVVADDEAAKDRPVCRPGPGKSSRGRDEQPAEHGEGDYSESCCPSR
jgi:hypothetical protein